MSKDRFEDKQLEDLYRLIEKKLRDYCEKKNIRVATVVGILYLLAHEIMHECDD